MLIKRSFRSDLPDAIQKSSSRDRPWDHPFVTGGFCSTHVCGRISLETEKGRIERLVGWRAEITLMKLEFRYSLTRFARPKKVPGGSAWIRL